MQAYETFLVEKIESLFPHDRLPDIMRPIAAAFSGYYLRLVGIGLNQYHNRKVSKFSDQYANLVRKAKILRDRYAKELSEIANSQYPSYFDKYYPYFQTGKSAYMTPSEIYNLLKTKNWKRGCSLDSLARNLIPEVQRLLDEELLAEAKINQTDFAKAVLKSYGELWAVEYAPLTNFLEIDRSFTLELIGGALGALETLGETPFGLGFCHLLRDFVLSSAGLCATCGSLAKMKCSRCKNIRYCSQECQKEHWSIHKLTCGQTSLEKLVGLVNQGPIPPWRYERVNDSY